MTACPPPARLAAAASGEDHAVLEHARTCLGCRATLIEQREIIDAARRLARPAWRPERRAALAAEVMAASDFAVPRWRGERMMIAATAVVLVAVVSLVVARRHVTGEVPRAPEIAILDEPALEAVQRSYLEPAPLPLRASVMAGDADFARVQQGEHDIVTLRDGEVSVDATDREPITIMAGDTRVTIASSRAQVVARRGVIVTTRVFAGTAQVTTNGRSLVIDAGDVWMREREPVADPPPTPASDALAAFREGWEALRAHRHTQAVAAFDRATDPVVAEDAAFWAAIASERAGDLDGAATRLRAFLDRFPVSPRAETARAALVRVTR